MVPPAVNFALSAGNGRDGRLGQHMGDAVALEGLDGGAEPRAARQEGQGALAIAAEHLTQGRVLHARGAGRSEGGGAGAEIDPELLQHAALDLDDRDLEHHLLLLADHEGVDEAAADDRRAAQGDAGAPAGRGGAAAATGGCSRHRRWRCPAPSAHRRRVDETREDDGVVDGLNVDVGCWASPCAGSPRDR